MSRNGWTKIHAQTLKRYNGGKKKEQAENTFLQLLIVDQSAKSFSKD